jgi:hypothetical protein
MVVHDLYIVRLVIASGKDDPPLVVYPHRVPANEIASQSFQPLAWREALVVESRLPVLH